MRIQLISHASVLTTTEDTVVWSDPWLESRVFNESWTLYPAPFFEPSMLERIDYLWISHEHPDHFNVPTLRGLPDDFKQRVTVLFQKNNSTKVFEALEKFGYRNFIALPHRKVKALTPGTEVYCYQIGQMDSCLGIRSGGVVALNVNDATVSPSDSRLMRQDFGRATVVLNQLSIGRMSRVSASGPGRDVMSIPQRGPAAGSSWSRSCARWSRAWRASRSQSRAC